TQEWVALLDCDDVWLPGHLARLYGQRGDRVLVAAAAITFGGERRAMGWAGAPRVFDGPLDAADPENRIVTSGVLLRRELALELGGFRASFAPCEDLDLWLRMLE